VWPLRQAIPVVSTTAKPFWSIIFPVCSTHCHCRKDLCPSVNCIFQCNTLCIKFNNYCWVLQLILCKTANCLCSQYFTNTLELSTVILCANSSAIKIASSHAVVKWSVWMFVMFSWEISFPPSQPLSTTWCKCLLNIWCNQHHTKLCNDSLQQHTKMCVTTSTLFSLRASLYQYDTDTRALYLHYACISNTDSRCCCLLLLSAMSANGLKIG